MRNRIKLLSARKPLNLIFLGVTHRRMACVTAKWLKASKFLILQSGLDTDLRYEGSAFNWSPPQRKAFSWSWLLIGWWRNCQPLMEFTVSLTVQTACRWNLSWTSSILKKCEVLISELLKIAVFECDVQISLLVSNFRKILLVSVCRVFEEELIVLNTQETWFYM